jgi:hypothetical protein
MEDGSTPPHKFTNPCREVMGLKVTEKDGTYCFAFDVIIPIRSGLHSSGAIITYRTDSILSAALAQNIRRCVTGWFFGYWVQVCKYKVGMVRKLMESFDIDSVLLAHFSIFDPMTLLVQLGFGDKDKLLEGVEADLGINQGWQANLENDNGAMVDVVGYP